MNIKDDFVLKNINEGYLVGGSVRDFLMGKTFCDRDITIKNAKVFAQKLAKILDAVFIELDSENQIYRLILNDKINFLDISELRGETIENDLVKRDFTINAVAYDLKNEKFIDVTGGIEDIKKKIICSINEQNFIDDPLRVLRAYRFASCLGFEIQPELRILLQKYALLIEKPAKERIHDELLKFFGGKYASKVLLDMYDDGILEIMIPSVKEMKKVPPNTHHHLDLIHHVIETVHQIELKYENSPYEVIAHLQKVDFGGYPRINYLKLAGFLHDIGKYSTWTLENDNKTVWKLSDGFPYPNDKGLRHRFIKHDIEGAKIVAGLLKNLKFSNKQIDYISCLIKHHIYPSSVISSPNLDNKIMLRYIRKMGNNVIDNIMLAQADRLSAQGVDVTKEMTENNINGLNKLLNFYLEVKDTLKPLPKLLDGKEIMTLLNLSPSPKLGEIIKALHEAQLNGEVNTKEQAVDFLKNL